MFVQVLDQLNINPSESRSVDKNTGKAKDQSYRKSVEQKIIQTEEQIEEKSNRKSDKLEGAVASGSDHNI